MSDYGTDAMLRNRSEVTRVPSVGILGGLQGSPFDQRKGERKKMTLGAMSGAPASNVVATAITGIMTVLLLASQMASLLEKLCGLLARALDRYANLADAFGKLGVAFRRFRSSWRRALYSWREPPEDPPQGAA
jgi:hypothetical protein